MRSGGDWGGMHRCVWGKWWERMVIESRRRGGGGIEAELTVEAVKTR